MRVWIVTTKEKNKVVGVYSSPEIAKKDIQDPENVKVTRYTVNVEKKKEEEK